jgi:hypothetical protein
MGRVEFPLRRLSTKDPYASRLHDLPNFGPNGNLTGMRKLYGWDKAMPVKCGAYVYDCRRRLDIYERAV